MNKNRIQGVSLRTSGHSTAKSISIKGAVRKSGGRASKVIELTRGDLRGVPVAGLSGSQGSLTAAQKSAEGILGFGRRPERYGEASRTRISWT